MIIILPDYSFSKLSNIWHDNDDDDDDDGEEDDDEEEVVMVLDAYGHATSRWALEWGFIEGMLMAESNVYCWG